ncbi:MAG: GNAT family N-acetyltransferase [Proteobacteria bacterium]|nr:GNAT family N-acetyltransferase [Pseudomonadota bacterium]
MSTNRLRIQRKPFKTLTMGEHDAWVRLLAESTSSRWAFLSPTYAEAVNVAIGPVEVLLCWDGDALVGVMPLQRTIGWLGQWGLWEPAGRRMTDYFGLLAHPGVKLDWQSLLRAAGVPCVCFTHLDESQADHGLTGVGPRVGLRTRIHPDGGTAHWEWLRRQDKKLVSDTERRERKLVAEHGPLEFQMQSASPVQDMESLVALKTAQYRRTGHDEGALLNPENIGLLTRLLASTSPDCLPMLSVLRCGGQLVAGHFGLQCGALLHYWFPAYNPCFSAYSPGRILTRHILLDAERYGITCLDRGEGDSAAKRDFATEEHLYFMGLVQASPWGQALGALQRLRWRLAS